MRHFLLLLVMCLVCAQAFSSLANDDDTLRDVYRDAVVLAQTGDWKVSIAYWEQQLKEDRADDESDHELFGLIYILMTIALEKNNDARAYEFWTQGLGYFLQQGTSWERYNARLGDNLERVRYQISSSFSADGVAISGETKSALVLQSLNSYYQFLGYQGPKPGLTRRKPVEKEKLTISRSYFPKPFQTQVVDETYKGRDNLPDVNASQTQQATAIQRGFGENALVVKAENIQEDTINVDALNVETPTLEVPAIQLTENTNNDPPPPKAAPTILVEASELDSGAERLEISRPTISRRISQAELSILSEEDLAIARNAWRYFENNRQVNTGLFNSVDGYPFTTMWDMGSALAAIVCAYEIGIIKDDVFNENMKTILQTLRDFPLYKDKYPNREYDTRSALMTDLRNTISQHGSGYSSIDIGRTLIWLKYIREGYDQFLPIIDIIVSKWRLDLIEENGEFYRELYREGKTDRKQEGRLGYEHYTAIAFSLWGINAEDAFDFEETEQVIIENIEIMRDIREPDYLNLEPFLLTTLEFENVSAKIRQQLSGLIVSHQNYSRKIDMPVLFSEDSLDATPWFLYNIVSAKEGDWICKNSRGEIVDKCQSLSTKAAFAVDASFDLELSREAMKLAKANFDPRKGYYAGFYRDGEANRALTANTNAIILESLAFKKMGYTTFLKNEDVYGQIQSRSRLAN